MELGSLIGFVLCFVGVFLGMVMKGANPAAMFTNYAALLIVIVGSIGAVFMSHSMKENMAALKALVKVFMPGKPADVEGTIKRLLELANKGRTDGLLGLEQEAQKVEDPFLRKGLLLAVDGTDAELIRDTLMTEVGAMKERHKASANWHQALGIFAPTFGIIGAVVGLIAVMSKLDDPSALGHGIGAAFVATFWGVFMANGMFLPWANKLKRLSAEEVACKMIVIDGILSIQAGTNPRALSEKLEGYLPPSQRQAMAS